MIYGYARVSTLGQAKDGNSLSVQKKMLIERGATELYFDTYTGTKSDRPQFKKLLLKIKRNDTLLVTKIDRLTRNLEQGIKIVRLLLKAGIIVHILNIGVIDSSPTGKLILNILMSFAEFERDMIVERTQEGKRLAKLKNPNFKEGRPRRVVNESEIHKAFIQNQCGLRSVDDIIREFKISKSYWYKFVEKYR